MKKPSRPTFVIGNWKMNPRTLREAEKVVTTLTKKYARPKTTVIIAPSFLHLAAVKKLMKKPYLLAAQTVHAGDVGPHTGSVSAPMLKEYGASAAIVGHSERRAEGETDKVVNTQVRALIAQGMMPIICVGERERDHHGKYYSFVEAQVRGALQDVSRKDIARVVVAYEPVWAISSGDGKGQTATPHDAHEMKLFIQKILVELYGRTIALRVPVLYGGSVNETTAPVLMKDGDIDGFLVGGASLKPDAFVSIIRSVEQAG
jgi:triosephosphate isomerase